jgi:uncharacterized protein YbbK (DUF523 family)
MVTEPEFLLTPECIATWPRFSEDAPLRVIVSACLGGDACGVDGTSNGVYPVAAALLRLRNVRARKFCPEDHAFGTPRRTPDIVGGSGFDVLDGGARVLSDGGDDWTEGMCEAAAKMRELAVDCRAHVALLMDISAACGSSVVYEGPRRLKLYRRGPGVAAAALARAGIPIVSQRDERTLALLFRKLEAPVPPLTDGLDHRERAWYREHLA